MNIFHFLFFSFFFHEYLSSYKKKKLDGFSHPFFVILSHFFLLKNKQRNVNFSCIFLSFFFLFFVENDRWRPLFFCSFFRITKREKKNVTNTFYFFSCFFSRFNIFFFFFFWWKGRKFFLFLRFLFFFYLFFLFFS